MALLLPVLAFITGLLLAQTSISETVKPILSAWLARLLIPIVIIYNMVFYQSGSLSLMLLVLVRRSLFSLLIWLYLKTAYWRFA